MSLSLGSELLISIAIGELVAGTELLNRNIHGCMM